MDETVPMVVRPYTHPATNEPTLENFLSDRFKRAVKFARQEAPELFDKDEKTFHQERRKLAAKYYDEKNDDLPLNEEEWDPILRITQLDETLRIKLWKEYGKAQDVGMVQIYDKYVLRGICEEDQLRDMVLFSPVKMAYLMIPPIDPIPLMDGMIHKGLDQMNQILDLPFIDPATNRPNNPLIAKKVEIIFKLLDRVYGTSTQNVSVQSKNMNVDVSVKANQPESLEQIKAKIKELESEFAEDPNVITVQAE